MPVISVYSPSYRRSGDTARFGDGSLARMWIIIVGEMHKRKAPVSGFSSEMCQFKAAVAGLALVL